MRAKRFSSKEARDGKYSKMTFDVGYKFPNTEWTVVDSVPYHKNGVKLRVKCMCGKEYFRSVSSLTHPTAPPKWCNSCRKTYRKKSTDVAWKGEKGIPSSYILRAKEGARQRNLSFEISNADAYQQFIAQSGTCALTGTPLHFTNATNTSTNASLDRIDSSQGYTSQNIQWVHKDINRMKNAYPQTYFVNMCHAVANATPAPSQNIFEQMGMSPIKEEK